MAEHVGIKVVTKKLKNGTVRRYKYYQLVKTYRKEGKHRTEYVRYLGKEIPPEFQHRHHVLANCDRDPAPVDSLSFDVLANRDAARPPPLDLEVIEPESKGFWSSPRYRATCRRCGRRFEMIQFEVELGHYLCPRCRAEIVKLGERSSWPGY